MMNKLRFEPALLFYGRQSSISEVAAIQSKLPFFDYNAYLIRCYAAFNFVADTYSDLRITHRGPLEKFHSEMSAGQQSPKLSKHGDQVLQNPNCSLPNCPDTDDDDFAELGLPVPKSGDTGLELSTEMKKPSVNEEPPRKLLVNGSEKLSREALKIILPGKVNSSTKTPPKQKIHQLGFRFNLDDRNGVSRTKSKSEIQMHVAENVLSHKSANSIIIEKVPLIISISQLKDALSVYGEISNAFLKHDNNRFKSCHIEFKAVESCERALVAGRVTVMNFHLDICGPHVPEIITVRIRNISMETAEPSIHSICMSCGSMKGLWKAKDGYVDALFSVKDHLATQRVLKNLNDVLMDDCQWSAQLLPKNTPNSMIDGSDSKRGVGSQISTVIAGLRKQLRNKRIYLEDLEELHNAIVHLRECPTADHL